MRPFAGRVPDLGRFGVATAVPFVAGLILGDDLPKLQCRCAGDAKRSALEADRAPPEAAGGSWSGVGELIPGAVDRGRYAISHGGNGPVRLQSLTIWNLEEARSALRKGEAPRIADLMEATADTFYGVRAQHYYGFSWLLTHFLQHGRKNWETDQSFARMLLYLAEGYASRDALAAWSWDCPGGRSRRWP